MPQERRIVHFSGRVQGVGFRWTTRRVAGGFAVTGYVKNLPDGRVLCEVEGDHGSIDAFIAAVEERMAGCVRHVDQQVAPATGAFDDFGIRH